MLRMPELSKSRGLVVLIAVALATATPVFAAQAQARPSSVTAEDCNASRGGKVKYEDGRRVCRSNDSRVDGLPIRG
ncbi:hypothetical protein [Nocardia heshunensis]